jgi:hypothetical protein
MPRGQRDGRNLGFLDRSRYFSFQVARQMYSRGWVDPVPDPLLLRKSGRALHRTRNSGHYTTEAVRTRLENTAGSFRKHLQQAKVNMKWTEEIEESHRDRRLLRTTSWLHKPDEGMDLPCLSFLSRLDDYKLISCSVEFAHCWKVSMLLKILSCRFPHRDSGLQNSVYFVTSQRSERSRSEV